MPSENGLLINKVTFKKVRSNMNSRPSKIRLLHDDFLIQFVSLLEQTTSSMLGVVYRKYSMYSNYVSLRFRHVKAPNYVVEYDDQLKNKKETVVFNVGCCL